ncbi:hypothetical protein YDYSY3_38170 [Paenibacillus chitinolyticus]|uniref:hypothetical protein n=1 Tax=Paenibacillus chitinolyticus TaxID=79263 RepID=UPI0026E4B7B8|nr:hypothetical protein [Paenibacillus chitinolyticus]GKS12817.1 hypothetical protein YDYSY3_38170 [Paenibacillus chitinolyticus]
MKKLTSLFLMSIFLFTFAVSSWAATTDSDGGTGPGGDVKYKNTNVSVEAGEPYDFVLNPSNGPVGLKTIHTFGNW